MNSRSKHHKKSLSKNIIRTISKSGFCSRKQALGLVMAGKVKINGKTVTDPGRIIRNSDKILVNEKPISRAKKRYILLHKPAGYVTTRKDELNRPTVYEFLNDVDGWMFPVGRLDLDSEGLLIFTNDTKFGNLLTDPHYEISRTYEVQIMGQIMDSEIKDILKMGLDIGRGEKTQPTGLRILSKNDDFTWVEISLRGGKNREIRRLFGALNRPVKRLIRTRFGPFELGSLKPGKWLELKEAPPRISKLIK
ncbi:MAG: pseudouridine synthase [Candidatus Omnitrophota bacterium]|nr:pseudouridine synthase [Candidatus Omnitrophota bacterium]